MKKLFLLLLCVSLASCGATNISLPVQEKTVQLEGDKNELYVKANQWMVENFNDAKSVIQFSDKEAGTVSGKYLMGVLSSGDLSGNTTHIQDVFTLITVDVKDDAARIRLKPEPFSTNAFTQGLNAEQAEAQLAGLMASFEDYMKNASTGF